MSDRDRLIAPGITEVGRVRCTDVKLEKVRSESVRVRDEAHAKANHYIKQIRPFFPKKKLPTYIHFPYLLQLARVLFVASLSGALVAAGVSIYIALFSFIVCVLFFYLYIQHEWVNYESIPVIFKQDKFEHQEAGNDFYEVTVTELDGVALLNYQAGVGVIHTKRSQGKVKFQAFNEKALKYVSNAKCQSRIMLVLFFMAGFYNFCFIMYALPVI